MSGSAAAAVGPAHDGLAFRLLLVSLVAVGPISTDLYLPALPAIAADLGTGPERAQLTLGVFIAGFAVAQLVCGPLADRFGRRPVLLAGMALYAVATLVCLVAPSIEVLLAARFVQALGGCAGPVIGRAIVRDSFPPREAAAVMGYLASAMALGPMVAPFLGGYLTAWFGWRATFAALLVFGLVVTVAIALRLVETRPRDVRPPRGSELLTNYGLLLRDPLFLGFTLAGGGAFAALFTWISTSSFLLIDLYGVTPEGFGWFFAQVAGAYVLGAYAGARASRRLGIVWTMAAGLALGVVAVLVAILAAVTVGHGAWSLNGCMALLFFAAAFLIPPGTAGAVMPFPHMAGTASALFGFLQMSLGVVANALAGLFFTGTAAPTLALLLASMVLAVLAFVGLVVPRRANVAGA